MESKISSKAGVGPTFWVPTNMWRTQREGLNGFGGPFFHGLPWGPCGFFVGGETSMKCFQTFVKVVDQYCSRWWNFKDFFIFGEYSHFDSYLWFLWLSRPGQPKKTLGVDEYLARNSSNELVALFVVRQSDRAKLWWSLVIYVTFP